mgnify:FL=1
MTMIVWCRFHMIGAFYFWTELSQCNRWHQINGNHEIRVRVCLLTCLQNVRFYRQNNHPKVYISFCNIVITLAINCYTSNKKKHQRDMFPQEITPVEIGQTVTKVKLLIAACITTLTPIIYDSVYSDLIATH